MTKHQAKAAMQAGKKVTHAYFGEDEFVSIVDGFIKDENGYQLNASDFWKYRESSLFDDGWDLYEGPGSKLPSLILLNTKPERYALLFRYHVVTNMTVNMALPRSLKRQGCAVKYAPETKKTAGTKRMNSGTILAAFPNEFIAFQAVVKEGKENYILIELVKQK